MIQESPSKFFLTASGILKPRHAAHRNRTPTAGGAILPWARKQGKSCLNGSGTRLLELGHQLHPDPVRTTEFAQAFPPVPAHTAPPSGYASPQGGLPWKTGRFSGQAFVLQPDGTLRCPASQSDVPHERRREADG
ncbi:MAG: hypothetical protein E6J31_02155, partial [Chloroflexi bacterium]